MVLFTAPEDMVIGQACKMSEREATPRQPYQMPEEVLGKLKTTRTLKQDALDYHVTKVITVPNIVKAVCLCVCVYML